MTARLYLWYAAHPRWGRLTLIFVTLQAFSGAAVSTAPRATASTNAAILNFTGLSDSYGMPIGDYYLAVASVRDQITQAGPAVTGNPASWVAWTAHTLETLLSSITVATALAVEAGLFVGIVALALWVMKITVSTYWLIVIGGIARAVAGAVIQVTTQIGLLVLAVPVGVLIGVATIKRGEAGRGWTMILIALTLPALSVVVFDDPAGEMYGPDGLLAFGRRVGFSVAEAATRNGALGGAVGGGGEVGALTASLITHTVREPLQLWNFGHVVDRVGGCGAAWSVAVHGGVPDGPIAAMASCGDRAAVAYAQHLDGTNVWIGMIFVLSALLLAVFMVVSGWAVLKVSVKAIWTTVILLPTLWLGAVPGAPQRRAVDVVWQFFRHGIEVMVYITYVSVIGLAVQRIVADPLPAALGGANPFAHVLMMGAVSIVALVLLRHVRAELSGRQHRRGLFGRGADVAVGMGMQAAVGGVGSAALSGAKGLRGRFSGGWAPTPWERLDRTADDTGQVHGSPQPGVDPVPNAPSDPTGTAASVDSRTDDESDRKVGASTGSAAPSGIAPTLEQVRGQPPRAADTEGAGTDDPAGDAAEVTPITDSVETAQRPLPPQPPQPAQEDGLPPSEEDEPAPRGPTTVDPIDDTL
jgi:hypothetical protein